MPGPTRRRNLPPETLKLPAAGRKGAAPKWPMVGKLRAGELAMWRDLWSSPQAVAWEKFGPSMVRVVARFVRLSIESEQRGAMAASRELGQLEDRLGLSPMAMRRLHWEIESVAVAPAAKASTSKPAKARRRLVVVDAADVA